MIASPHSSSVQAGLSSRWRDARAETDRLFALLDRAALYDRPIPERHRIIFYLGHLEAFDWNLLEGTEPLHASFDHLFAFGIDPVDGGLPSDQPDEWPSERETREYGARIRKILDASEYPEHLMNVAIEHRLMHAETLAYMLHQLPFEKKTPSFSPIMSSLPRKTDAVEVEAGPVTLGLEDAGEFGWDNEFDAHTVHVPGFVINRYKVSNGEYLKFVEEGGSPPVFWVKRGTYWFFRTMFEEIPLPLDWPVYVSHADASAYAQWAGKHLPTESQWQRAALGPAGDGNHSFKSWNPAPVTRGGISNFGAVEMRGNGWEWTSSIFAPFPGFEPFACYPGYSANFFDGRHYVMKGASPRTAACMVRPSFRNWFQPNYPYIYAGFRCVKQS